MSKGQKRKHKKPRDRQRSKGSKEEEGTKEEKTKRNIIIVIAVVVIVVISVIAFILLRKPSEEEPPEPKWWSYESSCTGVNVTNITKARDATGWNVTAYLFLDKGYRNLTVTYIIDWDDGNHTDDSIKMRINTTEYVLIAEQESDIHYPTDAEPLSVHVVVSECD